MPGPDYLAPILRRWYVVLLGLLVTVGGLVTVAGSAQPTYRSEATYVLVPGDTTIPEAGNRFLYLGGLVQARDVVLTLMNSDAVRQNILGTRTDWNYVAVADTKANGPMIVISASAPDAADSMELRGVVQDALPDQLDSLQDEAGTPEEAKFTSLALAEDAVATTESKGALRLVLVVGLLGVGLSLVAAGAIDALVLSRRARRQKRRRDASQAADEPGSADASEPDPERSSDSGLVATTPGGTAQPGPG